jgi:hypothetical protein
MPLPAPPAGKNFVNAAIPSSLVFIAKTFEATRSAETEKTLWRLTSGDGVARSKEDKRGPTATAGRAFFPRRRAVAAMNTRELGI